MHNFSEDDIRIMLDRATTVLTRLGHAPQRPLIAYFVPRDSRQVLQEVKIGLVTDTQLTTISVGIFIDDSAISNGELIASTALRLLGATS